MKNAISIGRTWCQQEKQKQKLQKRHKKNRTLKTTMESKQYLTRQKKRNTNQVARLSPNGSDENLRLPTMTISSEHLL